MKRGRGKLEQDGDDIVAKIRNARGWNVGSVFYAAHKRVVGTLDHSVIQGQITSYNNSLAHKIEPKISDEVKTFYKLEFVETLVAAGAVLPQKEKTDTPSVRPPPARRIPMHAAGTR